MPELQTLPSAAYFVSDEIRQVCKLLAVLPHRFLGPDLEPLRVRLFAVVEELDGLRDRVVAGEIPVVHPSAADR